MTLSTRPFVKKSHRAFDLGLAKQKKGQVMKTICQSCGATVVIPDRMTATQAARVLARLAAATPPSPARQAASRANGRKGGRPRKRPTTGAEGAQ
jgi:hypothetical protein